MQREPTIFLYHADIKPDPHEGFLVVFPDIPEALTHGETREVALSNAREALGLALRGVLVEGRLLPAAACRRGTPVAVEAADALKLAVIQAFRSAAMTKTELARRIGRSETEARRILDPDHGTKLQLLQQALAALGKTVVISVQEAA